MGFFYIVGSSTLIYTIVLAILTIVNTKYIEKNTEGKKFIAKYSMYICLPITILLLYLTNNDSMLGVLIGLIGLISIPGDIILQWILWGIIQLEAATWEEKVTVDANGVKQYTWTTNQENTIDSGKAFSNMMTTFQEIKEMIPISEIKNMLPMSEKTA